MRDVNWEQLHEIRAEPKKRRIRSVPPLEFAGMVFASRSFFGTEKPGDELHEPAKAGAGPIKRGGDDDQAATHPRDRSARMAAAVDRQRAEGPSLRRLTRLCPRVT